MGSHSAVPIASIEARLKAYRRTFGRELTFFKGDLRNYDLVHHAYRKFRPEAVVYLGQIPSAAYSMIDVHHAAFTQQYNIIGTLVSLYAIKAVVPDCHLIKLGTMGEYGTPNVDIPEGFFDLEHHGRKAHMLFPRQAGSWYHQSKVHDSHNIEMACRLWNLRSTDIMQGVVYGSRIDEMGTDSQLTTRFDFDQGFGTAINRFCAQAVIGMPLTVFGRGGQRRGFIPLKDSMHCMTLAIERPPGRGEYRIFNQFESVYDVASLADKVRVAGNRLDLNVVARSVDNPRIEKEQHYYNPESKKLVDLGYRPTRDMDAELVVVLTDLIKNRKRILAKRPALMPDIRWDGQRRRCKYLDSYDR
jgi:UDP-sulfoquinovose synthase